MDPKAIRFQRTLGSGRCQSPDRLRPLLRSLIFGHHFFGPPKREVDWRSDQEGEALSRTRTLDLAVEFERLSGKMSANIQQNQVVNIGLPKKPRSGESLGGMYLDAMTLQNPDPHVARRLVPVDEEDFLTS